MNPLEAPSDQSSPCSTLDSHLGEAFRITPMDDDQNRLRIGELAELVGLSIPQLRRYAKLDAEGIKKVIPDFGVLEMAWKHAYRRELINRAIRDAYEQINVADGEVPEDLVTRVTDALHDDPTLSWDYALVDLVLDDLP